MVTCLATQILLSMPYTAASNGHYFLPRRPSSSVDQQAVCPKASAVAISNHQIASESFTTTICDASGSQSRKLLTPDKIRTENPTIILDDENNVDGTCAP